MSAGMAGIAAGTAVRMGTCELVFGDAIVEMKDSGGLLGDVPALRRRLEEDGYLYLRGFHPREEVLAARREVVALLMEAGCLDADRPADEAWIGADDGRRRVDGDFEGASAFVYDVQNRSRTVLFKLAQLEARVAAYRRLVGSERFVRFFGELLGGTAEARLQNSIPRAVPTGEFTGAHYDVVYFGPHNDHIYTGWMPLGDLPLALGPLAVLLGSHRFERVRETYGRMHTSRDRIEGWFSTDALEMVHRFGGTWASTNFTAGDVVLFGMYFMHGSLNNETARYRLSSDCRYQLVANRKVELPPPPPSTWMPERSMKDARAAWGV